MLFGPFKQEFAGRRLAYRNSEEIAIQSYAPALRPVCCLVIVDTQPETHRAEECMLYRIDHNADVSAPNDEIAGLARLLAESSQFRCTDQMIVHTDKRSPPVGRSCARDESSPVWPIG